MSRILKRPWRNERKKGYQHIAMVFYSGRNKLENSYGNKDKLWIMTAVVITNGAFAVNKNKLRELDIGASSGVKITRSVRP